MCLLAAYRGSNCTLTHAIGWPQFALLAPLALANELLLPAIVKRGRSRHGIAAYAALYKNPTFTCFTFSRVRVRDWTFVIADCNRWNCSKLTR